MQAIFIVLPALALVAVQAQAQTYPTRSVRIVVPFSPGGAVDVPTRLVGQEVSRLWGQQVVVDNRPGAGGTIGADLAAKAAPDGYTLMMSGPPLAIGMSLYKKLAYNALTDFVPILELGYSPNALVVHPSLPVKSIKELVALTKLRPGQVDYASSGNGSTQHLCAALFTSLAGVRMNHIPYRGSAPALTDLLAGQVQVSIPSVNNVLQHVRNGKLRALGVTSKTRSRELPEVPAIDESGLKGYEAVTWIGLFAPAALPRDLLPKLHADFTRALQSAEVQKGILATGTEVRPGGSEALAARMKSEVEKWGKVIRDTGTVVN